MRYSIATRRLGAALAASLACAAPVQAQNISDDVVRIGVLSDMSGLYADTAGRGSVEAARMAVEDFGGKVLGKTSRWFGLTTRTRQTSVRPGRVSGSTGKAWT